LNLTKVLKSSGNSVNPIKIQLFCEILKKEDLAALIANMGIGPMTKPGNISDMIDSKPPIKKEPMPEPEPEIFDPFGDLFGGD